MITKLKYANIILVIIVIIIAAKCDSDKNTIEGVPITEYYDSCLFDDYSFGDMSTMGDPYNKFMVSLPYDWDIRQVYTDSVFGIQAGNFLSIPIEVNRRMFFMVSGYSTEFSLEQYYLNELKTLKKESNVQLLETGKTIINELDSYWVKFSSNEEVFHLVVYIKRPELQDLYLLQASVYNPEEHDIMLCYMKQLFDSFEITE